MQGSPSDPSSNKRLVPCSYAKRRGMQGSPGVPSSNKRLVPCSYAKRRGMQGSPGVPSSNKRGPRPATKRGRHPRHWELGHFSSFLARSVRNRM